MTTSSRFLTWLTSVAIVLCLLSSHHAARAQRTRSYYPVVRYPKTYKIPVVRAPRLPRPPRIPRVPAVRAPRLYTPRPVTYTVYPLSRPSTADSFPYQRSRTPRVPVPVSPVFPSPMPRFTPPPVPGTASLRAPEPVVTGGMVWMNTKSHVYWRPGTRYYGRTKEGRYASEAEAVQQGYRPGGG